MGPKISSILPISDLSWKYSIELNFGMSACEDLMTKSDSAVCIKVPISVNTFSEY